MVNPFNVPARYRLDPDVEQLVQLATFLVVVALQAGGVL